LPGTKNIVSLMVVPHNSNKIKTWRISNINFKIFTFIAFIIVIIISLFGYSVLVTRENRLLRDQQANLYDFFMEQQKIVNDKLSIISDVEKIDSISKDKIQEFALQVQDITKNYIEKETKALTVSRSSSAINNPNTSFVGKIAELKAILNFLEEIDSQEDELFAGLTEKKEELRNYLDHLPTFWPTKGVIESEFGNRLHPIYKRFINHTGVDIGGKKNNPIYAAASGQVIFAGKNGGYGYCIDIDHGNGIVTRYAHCSKLLVKTWQKVSVGQEIAKVGQTGTATGPHLHFEIIIKDKQIDPTIFIGTKP